MNILLANPRGFCAGVDRAIEIVKELLDNHEGMAEDFPPRVFFNEFNSDSLNIMVMYWYHPPDYWAFMDFSQRVNLELIKRFNKAGIEFAFPTQTIQMDEKIDSTAQTN